VGRSQRKLPANCVAVNRKASLRYDISDTYEAGLVLRGSEVKSIRAGQVDISEAYAAVERGEMWLRQMYIASFFAARAFPHAERGSRKLLLHAREIRDLERAISREGYTVVALDVHFNDGRAKVTLGVGRGRKDHDKRAILIEKTLERETLRATQTRRQRLP
jgi:SsrA-binding protein